MERFLNIYRYVAAVILLVALLLAVFFPESRDSKLVGIIIAITVAPYLLSRLWYYKLGPGKRNE